MILFFPNSFYKIIITLICIQTINFIAVHCFLFKRSEIELRITAGECLW